MQDTEDVMLCSCCWAISMSALDAGPVEQSLLLITLHASSAGTAKIADVGLARIMQHTLSNTATGDPAGTFAYAAPEMLMGEKWDDKVRVSRHHTVVTGNIIYRNILTSQEQDMQSESYGCSCNLDSRQQTYVMWLSLCNALVPSL